MNQKRNDLIDPPFQQRHKPPPKEVKPDNLHELMDVHDPQNFDCQTIQLLQLHLQTNNIQTIEWLFRSMGWRSVMNPGKPPAEYCFQLIHLTIVAAKMKIFSEKYNISRSIFITFLQTNRKLTILSNCFSYSFMQFTRIANASGAPIAHQTKALLIKILCQATAISIHETSDQGKPLAHTKN